MPGLLCFGHRRLPFGKRRMQVGDVRSLRRGIRRARTVGCRECQHRRGCRGHESDQEDHKRDATAVGAGAWCFGLRVVHIRSAVAHNRLILTD